MIKKILHVVGARPNFMKLAPVYSAINKFKFINQILIHTGQHYDYNMSDIFFEEFNIPLPNENLSICGGSVLEQIGKGVILMEAVLKKHSPDLLIVYGDVNAAAFSAIAASKLGIKIAHIEAGLRSFDRSMPEETNRIIVDSLASYYFTPSSDANINLINEGVAEDKIFYVGNVMIDTLKKYLLRAKSLELNLKLSRKYILVTLHRPSNVDDYDNLVKILNYLNGLSEEFDIIFPMHPRTKNKLSDSYLKSIKKIFIIDPIGYLQFLKLQINASFIITDSGGIQEESTYLQIPCFTLRNNTERPITLTVGSNTLIGNDILRLQPLISDFRKGVIKKGEIPDLWDGKASIRISNIIKKLLCA